MVKDAGGSPEERAAGTAGKWALAAAIVGAVALVVAAMCSNKPDETHNQSLNGNQANTQILSKYDSLNLIIEQGGGHASIEVRLNTTTVLFTRPFGSDAVYPINETIPINLAGLQAGTKQRIEAVVTKAEQKTYTIKMKLERNGISVADWKFDQSSSTTNAFEFQVSG